MLETDAGDLIWALNSLKRKSSRGKLDNYVHAEKAIKFDFIGAYDVAPGSCGAPVIVHGISRALLCVRHGRGRSQEVWAGVVAVICAVRCILVSLSWQGGRARGEGWGGRLTLYVIVPSYFRTVTMATACFLDTRHFRFWRWWWRRREIPQSKLALVVWNKEKLGWDVVSDLVKLYVPAQHEHLARTSETCGQSGQTAKWIYTLIFILKKNKQNREELDPCIKKNNKQTKTNKLTKGQTKSTFNPLSKQLQVETTLYS